MGWLNQYPDDSAFPMWDYADLLCNLYSLGWRDRRMPKTLPLLSNLSCPFPTKPLVHMMQRVTDWVSIPLLFPSNSSILPLHLRTLLTPIRARELGQSSLRVNYDLSNQPIDHEVYSNKRFFWKNLTFCLLYNSNKKIDSTLKFPDISHVYPVELSNWSIANVTFVNLDVKYTIFSSF